MYRMLQRHSRLNPSVTGERICTRAQMLIRVKRQRHLTFFKLSGRSLLLTCRVTIDDDNESRHRVHKHQLGIVSASHVTNRIQVLWLQMTRNETRKQQRTVS